MSYTLLAHRGDILGPNGGTGGTFDSTGADLLVVVLDGDRNAMVVTPVDIQDSKSNTWNPLTLQGNVGDGAVKIFWSRPTSVGTGHTVSTLNGTNSYASLDVSAWSGSVASPADQQNGTNASGVTTLQPGSITPTESNELVIVGVVHNINTTGSFSIDSGFTIADQHAGAVANHYGGGLCYKIQTTAAAVNPTVTPNVSAVISVAIASFKDTPAVSDLAALIGEPITGSSVIP